MTMTLLMLLLVLATHGQAEAMEILDVSVARESHDEVELRIRYRLGPGIEASIGAITLFGESSTGHWAYRAARLTRGTGVASVTVGRNREAPPVYRSDAFEVRVWGGARAEHIFPFEKLWCVQPDACDERLLVEAAQAPLHERLTSVFPSIRALANAEVAGYDDDALRSLLPAVAERAHHAELGVRFNALRLLRDWRLSDPALTPTLVEAMDDPHPGISRVATDVLSRLVTPEDTLAEDALVRASTSEDESTRQYAEDGLKRLKRQRELARKPGLGRPVPDDAAACEAAGGEWGRFGLYVVPECNLPTPDAGRMCLDSDECVSACVSEHPVANAGGCYGWTILRGTCLSYVEDGSVGPPLCVE